MERKGEPRLTAGRVSASRPAPTLNNADVSVSDSFIASGRRNVDRGFNVRNNWAVGA